MIERRHPGHAAVGALENTSRNRSEVIRIRIARNTGYSQNAPATEGSDLPPLHSSYEASIHLGVKRGRQTQAQQYQGGKQTAHSGILRDSEVEKGSRHRKGMFLHMQGAEKRFGQH